ncbi:hypothetical protein [Cytobacillus stercorigallinarum]|uniref:hypothetical protein n=1 Tax=Cytobacillus stercorigallinarum TaxID=2762240 RepID=UPI001CD87944|nr:hypothetical protein [Cytobacillus stercorigallinarum]
MYHTNRSQNTIICISLFSSLAKPLFDELTTLNEEEINLEMMFSFTVISCYEFYHPKDQNIGHILNFSHYHYQDLFVQTTIYWLDTFMNYFSINISGEEYSALFVNLMYLHYSIQIFNGPAFLFKEDLFKVAFEQEPTYYVKLMNEFYDELQKNTQYSTILNQREKLIGRYHSILKQIISFNPDPEPIKIKLFSILNDNFRQLIIEKLNASDLHIKLCNDTESPDLIITDRLYLDLKKYNTKIFVWNSIPNNKDYERLKTCIEYLHMDHIN